jgi:hypothetical protein
LLLISKSTIRIKSTNCSLLHLAFTAYKVDALLTI